MRDLIARQPKWLVFGLPSWAVVIGVGLSIYGGHLLLKSSQSTFWPSTDGIVKTADIRHCSGSHGTTSAAEVTYDYTVNGKPLIGNKIRMVKVYCSDMSYAQEDLEKYPVGKKVKVFYCPTDSADSVLEPGIHFSSWLLPITGGLLVVFPLAIMAVALICRNRSKAHAATVSSDC